MPREPAAFGAWLREKSTNNDVFFVITQPLRDLHSAILDKLENDPRQANTPGSQPNGSTGLDLTPPARAVAAAYDLQREGKPISLKAACKRAGVDRANLRKLYPEAARIIAGLAAPDGKPPRAIHDRRTGNIDAVED